MKKSIKKNKYYDYYVILQNGARSTVEMTLQKN